MRQIWRTYRAIGITILLGGMFLTMNCLSALAQPTKDTSTDAADRATHYISTRPPLAATPYTELPLGQVKPHGWLRDQLERMAAGMAGRLDEIYPVVGESNAWRGGKGDAWERGPYWLDGLIPLAYLLENEELIAKAKPFIEWTLASQQENGFFGPAPGDPSNPRPGIQTGNKADWWPRMVMLQVLRSHYEATGDERVIPFMRKYFRYQLETLPEKPLNNWTHWAEARGGENLQTVLWLYNQTGDEFLLELAPLLTEQTLNWSELAAGHAPSTHGVNIAMGLKQPALVSLYTGDPADLADSHEGLARLMQAHGQVTGMFSGDELLHGRVPTQGTEGCTIVELMASLETLLAISGNTDYADHLERIAYNALPAHVHGDYMTRQYYQQPNQVRISPDARNFITRHGDGLCFGLLTGYPCCTANIHQGWPKLVAHLWYATADNGLAALVYGPCEVEAKVGADGQTARFIEKTSYPFEETVQFDYEGEDGLKFPLHLRIPGWCDDATIQVNGQEARQAAAGTIEKLNRTWHEGDTVTLNLPAKIQVSDWADNSIGIERGPLVFAYSVPTQWETIGQEFGVPTYAAHSQEPWNYALVLEDRGQPSESVDVINTDDELATNPWTPTTAPLSLQVSARKVPRWQLYNNSAGPLPHSPVPGGETTDETKTIKLVPYGSTALRISVFPWTWR